jgi:hypothetical protein
VPYTVADEPDTLLYRDEVKHWMEEHWHHGPCPVCSADEWEAEGRVFVMPRLAPYLGLIRPVFPIRCITCGYMVLINAKAAGVLDRAFPNDLSGLGGLSGT